MVVLVRREPCSRMWQRLKADMDRKEKKRKMPTNRRIMERGKGEGVETGKESWEGDRVGLMRARSRRG